MDATRTGRFIREQRKKKKLSQAALAEMLYVEPQTISKWERGIGMPDYDNIDKLREIFGCTLTEILEPEEAETEAEAAEAEEESLCTSLVLIETQKQEKQEAFNSFRFFDFLRIEKVKVALEKMFGVEYAGTYNKKFLFSNVLKKRSREEFETTLTQGMFRGKETHPVLGLQAPWLYMCVLFFMLACMGLTFIGALIGYPVPFILVTALGSTLPLLTFLFESNFSRDLSLIDVFKMFMLGGIGSILLTLIFNFSEGTLGIVLFAPLFEELFKAAMVFLFVAKIKPNNILTGLLIGFSIGAGFSFFEDLGYAFHAFLGGGEEAIWEGCAIIIARSFCNFFSGHHHYTGIFAALFVFFKKGDGAKLADLKNGKIWLALLFSIALHMLWNASAVMVESVFILSLLFKLLVIAASLASLIILINVGIAKIKIRGICDEYFNDYYAK